ncbi:SBBP repeat-containing protein [Pelosinus sp. sgz500959]|uniref:SBBP repeat-containing protein n=1 Tax=Pelosinus sp. sgz500959 TaxID=3242472 RepID=UPI00366E0650
MKPRIKKHCLLPIYFQLNRGQNNPEVKFLAQASGYNLLLTPSATVIILKPSADTQASTAVLQLEMSGANEHPQLFGVEELPSKVNYFVGDTPDKWLTNIPTYAKVKYQNIYPGIDILYSFNELQLEWDFIVHPGANPDLIILNFARNDKICLDDYGNLLLTLGKEQIRISKPIIYQESSLQRSSVLGNYTLNGHQVGFQLGNYDSTKLLVIDPILEYSTYLGGLNEDKGYGIATDSTGNVYVTGLTWSSWTNPLGFPIKNPYQADNAGTYNAFITKIDPTGLLVYSTYLGGSNADTASSIAVDINSNIYVTGSTCSTDFPTKNPIQVSNNGNWDAFVTKINATGNALIYSTYLGGTQDDGGYGIVVDQAGSAYVTGYTQSSSAYPPGFPTKNSIQSDNNSIYPLNDAFVTKINADGSLGYSTYLGGSKNDIGFSITVDQAGNAYVTGSTMSVPPNGFPITPGCFQPGFGGNTDAFITKFNVDGSLGYSSYLGGNIYDAGLSVTVDSSSNTYITGYTSSTNFPTKNPFQASSNGDFDVFVTKVNTDGSSLVYSTYLGGTSDDIGYGITVDANKYAYVTGSTYSSGIHSPPGFPIKNFIQAGGSSVYPFNDAFITKIKPDGSALIYSTYLGGKSYDEGHSIATDSNGNTYVTGFTFSSWSTSPSDPPPGPPGFPIKNPLQANNNGPWDVFVLKLTAVSTLTMSQSASPDPLLLGQNLIYHITVTNNGPDLATNVIVTDTLPPDVDFVSVSTGCNQNSGIVTCNLGILEPDLSITITITIKPKHAGIITNTATVTSRQSNPVTTILTTTVTQPTQPFFYTNRVIKTDWRKHPPLCIK